MSDLYQELVMKYPGLAKAFREIEGTIFGDMNGKMLPEEQQEEMRKVTKAALIDLVRNIDAEEANKEIRQ